MPELPEVETIVNQLQQTIVGKKIIKAEAFIKNLRISIPDDFSLKLQGAKVLKVKRRARYCLSYLDNGFILIKHFGMSGKIRLQQSDNLNLIKHDHAYVVFDDNLAMIYNDPRKFGFLDICSNGKENQHKFLSNLGIEPLTEEFDGDYLKKLFRNKNINVKTALMDNRLVVGVGNIYSAESLFKSAIRPTRKAKSITLKECHILVSNIKKTLIKAIKAGGSTLQDYKNTDGQSGYFQHQFNVYGRNGKRCFLCAEEIFRIRQNGRSTFYCKKCQK